MSKGGIDALCEFYNRDYQQYEQGKTYEPFRLAQNSEYSCGNPIIIGYIKSGRLAWQEQWIEVCKCEDTGKWGFGVNTASDSAWGGTACYTGSGRAYLHLPHPNYEKYFTYDSLEDAIWGAINLVESILEKRGDANLKGTRKMLALAKEQLKPKGPTITQLSLF